MEQKKKRWLQLSDIHIGRSNNPWMDNAIRSRLIEFLEHDVAKIDFILITGDIIDKGQLNDEHLRKQAKELIDSLKTISERIIFAVGNHDYVRNEDREAHLVNWCCSSDAEKTKKGENILKCSEKDFNDFVMLCKYLDNEDNPIETGSYVTSPVPDLNVIVLNTSIFSGQPELVLGKKTGKVYDDGNLWMPSSELPNYADLKGDAIVVGHHTIQMFEEESQNRIKRYLRDVPAQGYFCGHVHRNAINKDDDCVPQYITAGMFDDQGMIASVSVFEMDYTRTIECRKFIYKSPKWIEQKEPPIYNNVPDIIEKFLSILREYTGIENDDFEQFRNRLKNMNYDNTSLKENTKINEEASVQDSSTPNNKGLDNVETRAVARIQYGEIRHQINIEKVLIIVFSLIRCQKAICQKELEEDWKSIYFENVKNIFDGEMQQFWGRILAKELIHPGVVSKRTLRIISDLSTEEAWLFYKLCKYVLNCPDDLGYSGRNDYFVPEDIVHDSRWGILFPDILRLENAELVIAKNFVRTGVIVESASEKHIYYGENSVITFHNSTDNVQRYTCDAYLLSQAGEEIYHIFDSFEIDQKMEDYFNYCKELFEVDMVPKEGEE